MLALQYEPHRTEPQPPHREPLSASQPADQPRGRHPITNQCWPYRERLTPAPSTRNAPPQKASRHRTEHQTHPEPRKTRLALARCHAATVAASRITFSRIIRSTSARGKRRTISPSSVASSA